MRRVRLWLIGLLLGGLVWGQCAMCRKNAEQANPGLAKGLRVGIVVLFVAPYAVAGMVGWLVYRRMRGKADEGAVEEG